MQLWDIHTVPNPSLKKKEAKKKWKNKERKWGKKKFTVSTHSSIKRFFEQASGLL